MESFAASYGFRKACPVEELLADKSINTVFILGPNNVHYKHFKAAAMDHLRRIYLENLYARAVRKRKAFLR